MKPGDLIEWFYKLNGNVVHPRETLWSSVMQQWVPIGGAHFLVSRAEGVLMWLPLGVNCKGLFRAREDDTITGQLNISARQVVPRARG
jgi:hypothetical protein